MGSTGFFVLAFDSTHHAIRAEGLLKRAGLRIDIMPTPRDISSSCGLSIRFPVDIWERVRGVLDMDPLPMKLYREIRLDKRCIYLEEQV